MGLINIIKPLSTFIYPGMSINLNNIKRKFWESQESKPGQLGENQECYICAMLPHLQKKTFEYKKEWLTTKRKVAHLVTGQHFS